MKTGVIRLAFASLTLLAATGCAALPEHYVDSTSQPRLAPPPTGNDMGQLIYLATQTMAERAGELAKDRPIVVATVVKVDDLNRSSSFGRLASQLIANRLAQRGYLVKDVTYMHALAAAPGTGEIVLSRDAVRASQTFNAQAVVAGTYTVGGKAIYLNIRMLRADTGDIISAADVVIPRDSDNDVLIANGGS